MKERDGLFKIHCNENHSTFLKKKLTKIKTLVSRTKNVIKIIFKKILIFNKSFTCI